MSPDQRAPEQYTPRADPAAIDDLRDRLRATRWPDAPEDAGWSLGTDLDLPPRARRLLGRRLRLAGVRRRRSGGSRTSGSSSAASASTVVHARAADRSQPGDAAAAQPRLARLVLALPQGHPAADRPRRARRRSGRCVRRDRSRHARLRLLRSPAASVHLDRRRRALVRADDRAGLRADSRRPAATSAAA